MGLFHLRTPGERDARAPRVASPAAIPQQIVLDVAAADRGDVLAIAAAHMGRAHGIDSATLCRALTRREAAASTALGSSVAVPHARVAGISRPLTLFLRTREAVAFDAPDGAPVRDFYVIIVPAAGDPEDHLQLLAAVAAALGDPDMRARLACAWTAQQVEEAFASRDDPPRPPTR